MRFLVDRLQALRELGLRIEQASKLRALMGLISLGSNSLDDTKADI